MSHLPKPTKQTNQKHYVMTDYYETIKAEAQGRWAEIISALTPLSGEVLTKGRDDHPCPVCNGESTIWPAKDAEQTGSIACRKCTADRPTADGIATVAAFGSMGQGEAARAIADYLGLSPGQTKAPELDIVSAVAKDKKMPLEAFLQFAPEAATRGKGRRPVARVAVYNGKGERHSYFDFAPGEKGWFARGLGMSGMFFPGRLPQAGETWLVVEGAKDAAALIGLGHNAAGLPTSFLPAQYADLFAGVDVVLVPDLDNAGQRGAQKSGGHLAGIAKSIHIARLRGEVIAKGGDDVRDCLRKHGADVVRECIQSAKPWAPSEYEDNPQDGRPEVIAQ